MVVVLEHVVISGVDAQYLSHRDDCLRVSVGFRLWPSTPGRDFRRLKESARSQPCKTFKVILVEEE